jgi:hypothetical protein
MSKMMTRMRRAGALVVLAAAAGAVPALALPGMWAPVQDDVAVANDPAAVLATAIRQELGQQPADASTEDLEGSIVYVLSQSDYSGLVISAALNSLRTQAQGEPQLRSAITNVQLALLRRRSRGTAAINGGGSSVGATGTTFFSPLLGPGGGGNGGGNYAR